MTSDGHNLVFGHHWPLLTTELREQWLYTRMDVFRGGMVNETKDRSSPAPG
ncbi:MAG: hypothetical protein JSW11_14955 [Candidatus Heimdallarchaeota archaeon]|nr:MAG: hypothetical protein JSW11_14955 [Candidatus Heimdallarchaeota archaeon]